jgi:rhodanese-related sulfurtransferase
MKRVTAKEAAELMRDGWIYLDVRSVPEFEAGHPEGAFNVPIMNAGGFGMTPNLGFMTEVETAFPKDAKIVVGCQAGGRSLMAAGLMQQAGYKDVVDQKAGFGGNGGEPGWRAAGLPVSTQAGEGRSYADLRAKKGA